MERVNRHLAEAGWTRFTRLLASLLIGFAVLVTIVAAHGNPTSQLSIGCYSVWVVAGAAVLSALLDRRK